MRLGIGDDAAVFRTVRKMDWVSTCDAFLEGVHFLPKTTPPDSVGYKSLARATSDLAAMGASPRFFFLTLALPTSRTGRGSITFSAAWPALPANSASAWRAVTRLNFQRLDQHYRAGRHRGRTPLLVPAPAPATASTSRPSGRAALGLELLRRRPEVQRKSPTGPTSPLSANSPRTWFLARAATASPHR